MQDQHSVTAEEHRGQKLTHCIYAQTYKAEQSFCYRFSVKEAVIEADFNS